jgi:membrane-associated protease RseP (regulator of RpoE activity)
VLVDTENEAIRKAGLLRGDILVAVRGYRVDNWTAYTTLRALNAAEPFTIKIWRNGTYLDLPPLPSSYRFGVNLKNYQAP